MSFSQRELDVNSIKEALGSLLRKWEDNWSSSISWGGMCTIIYDYLDAWEQELQAKEDEYEHETG